jgi:hypothetical protein
MLKPKALQRYPIFGSIFTRKLIIPWERNDFRTRVIDSDLQLLIQKKGKLFSIHSCKKKKTSVESFKMQY